MSIKTCFNCFFSHDSTRQNRESVGIFQESCPLEWPFWFSQCPANSGGQNMLGKVPSDYVLKELEQIFRSTLQLSKKNSQILHAISSCGWQGCGNKYSSRASSIQFAGESMSIQIATKVELEDVTCLLLRMDESTVSKKCPSNLVTQLRWLQIQFHQAQCNWTVLHGIESKFFLKVGQPEKASCWE